MTEVAKIECVIAGAGVVGLAIARELAMAGREVVVLEAENAIGTGISSRNSEVVHAGIYYPKNSLKARLCVEGLHLLYRYLEEHAVAHRRCGKFIVATEPGQESGLGEIAEHARANGVNDIMEVTGEWARMQEPALRCVAALHSPSTGIVDSHAYMLSLRGGFEDHGGMIAFSSPLLRAEITQDGFLLHVGGANPMRIHTRLLVNSAGLFAPALARRIEGLDVTHVPPAFFAKGNYFTLSGRAPFSHLIYPIPERAGLGIHLTLDISGQARFGPDVEWIEFSGKEIDYKVDPSRGNSFYAAIRRYWPSLADNALQPAYAGIRPKIQSPTEPAKDFVISGPEAHGLNGLVNLFGIESPGLTASLSIARKVRTQIEARA